MSLELRERWLWDFWFAREDGDVHVFFLQAPRALGDPELRHRHATIGHAVSRDLRRWRLLPDALAVGPPGEFDDLATWTGSVIRHESRWRMYYSGISRAEDGRVQRVGTAVSEDLIAWERQGVIVEADPEFYETLGDGVAEEHWRDPWVQWDAGTSRFHMLVAARAADGPPDARGVVGYASSADGRRWRVGPPLSAAGELRQLEVPQLVRLGGAWQILFSAAPHDHGAARLSRPGVVAEWGTHYLVSDAMLGPYALAGDRFLVGGPEGRYYAGRLIEHRGAWHFLAWRLHDEQGRFAGGLSDPMPVRVGPGGSLAVELY